MKDKNEQNEQQEHSGVDSSSAESQDKKAKGQFEKRTVKSRWHF